MRRDLLNSALAVLVLTAVLGLAYPLADDRRRAAALPRQRRRQPRRARRADVGSRLIGQSFAGLPRYFQSRPSATGYDAAATSFDNLGPNSAALRRALAANLRAYLRRERPYDRGLTRSEVPVDAVTFSASGVDPEISQANARIQAHRVAAVRGLPLRAVLDLIARHTEGRGLGLFGEPGVNVLELNLALDEGGRRVSHEPLRNEPRSLFDRAILARAALDSLRKLDPRHQLANPVMFVVEVGAAIATARLAGPALRRPAARRRQRPGLVRLRDRRLALAHRRLLELRRGAGRGARQGAGRGAALDANRDRGPPARRRPRSRPPSCTAATWSWSRRARRSPATAP